MTHTHTNTGHLWTSGQPTQRPFHDTTQLPQETDLHAPDGILTRNYSKRAPADPRLRPRGYWDRLIRFLRIIFLGLAARNFLDRKRLSQVRNQACTVHVGEILLPEFEGLSYLGEGSGLSRVDCQDIH